LQYLEHKVPPLLLLLCFALAVWWLATVTTPVAAVLNPLLSALALLAFIGGLIFCLAAVWYFRRAHTTVDPRKPEQTSALVCNGIYRWSRNPMYVGFALFLLAQTLYLGVLWGILLLPLFIAYLQQFQIKPEERALQTLFGAAYQQYCQQVRRWL
jgi:protein-S-isoprenylcysteine O-methyltransferase Ste14